MYVCIHVSDCKARQIVQLTLTLSVTPLDVDVSSWCMYCSLPVNIRVWVLSSTYKITWWAVIQYSSAELFLLTRKLVQGTIKNLHGRMIYTTTVGDKIKFQISFRSTAIKQ